MEKDNVTMVMKHFITALAIPLTYRTLKDDLEKHPNYNSLLAISEVLDNWHVPNAAYELRFDELIATDIDVPFIAFVSKNDFVTVNRLDKTEVIVSNERWNKRRLSLDEFKKIYSGSILIAEKDEISGEIDYALKRRKEIINNLRVPVVIYSAAILLFSWLIFMSPYLIVLNWQIGLLTVLKTTGLVITILLLIQSIDTNNPLIQKLCGGDNNKNCNAILSSNSAKLTNEISWSEIGFFYFAGGWLTLLFNSNNSSILFILALLNVISLPYTFYSIHYQWLVAKQWCKLCCAVQAVLWLECFLFFPSLLNGTKSPELNTWAGLLICMTIPMLGWILLKPYLLLSKHIGPLKSQLRQFKYNTKLFNLMLNEELQYELPEENSTLIIGNPQAEKVITMVSNPYCQPCAKAHKGLEWLNGRDDIKLQVIFITDNDTDQNAEVAWHLMSIQKGLNDNLLKKAMNDWYEQKQKNYHDWAKIYPKNEHVINDETLKKQREWCKLTKIEGTPALFLNGRRLPKNYEPEEMKYFI